MAHREEVRVVARDDPSGHPYDADAFPYDSFPLGRRDPFLRRPYVPSFPALRDAYGSNEETGCVLVYRQKDSMQLLCLRILWEVVAVNLAARGSALLARTQNSHY